MHKTSIGVLFLLALMLATTAYGGTSQPAQRPHSKLSHRLEQLIAPGPQSRTQAEFAQAISLPEHGAGSLMRSPTGDVVVNIRVRDTSAATQAELVAAGARITHVAARYNNISALVPSKQLSAVANISGVLYVGESLQPQVRAASVPAAAQPYAARSASCPTGILTEGDTQLKAAEARAAFGVSGAGISIGVLSDSFGTGSGTTTPEQDIASGDLPGAGNPCGNTTPVNVIQEGPSRGIDEGRAMLQIIHDIAPAADLLFATADGDLFAFADNIRALRQAGADILVDDIVYFGEPFFQDGPINVAIKEVVAEGAQYFTAAGNANVIDRAGHNVSSYEAAAFRPTACPALPNLAEQDRPDHCHNFAPSGSADPTSSISLDSGASLQIELQWAEPWFGVETELDFYLVNNATGRVVAAALGTNTGVNGSQRPFELLSYTAFSPVTVSVVIGRSGLGGTATPRIKYVIQGSNTGLPGNGIATTEYHQNNNTVDRFGPTIGDHAATPGALSIAATAYNDGVRTERYSSIGPATHYFGPVVATGNISEPFLVKQAALPLAQPLVIHKPDLAATDGVATTFFNQFDVASQRYRFFGTSAAAPHAAAVAALVSEAARARGLTANAALIEQTLECNAAPMLSGSPANGAGLIDALAAVRGVENPQCRLFVPLIMQPKSTN